MKKLIDLKGAVSLNKAQQKEVNGGGKLCNANCSGRPNGSMCYYQGHCGCPGQCFSGYGCVPW
ncbi:MAG: hypothetical protein ACI9Y7_000215 [Dokdonia sp.]|jgi:hypothetical protein